MVTRKSKRGTVIGERERLTMEEAVHAYTYCGAFTQFAEGQVGRLVPGQAADIAILSHDIFAVEPEVVETQARCDMTILGGEIVFDRLGQFANAAA
jgi:predicted amidohydrolase YtcJ